MRGGGIDLKNKKISVTSHLASKGGTLWEPSIQNRIAVGIWSVRCSSVNGFLFEKVRHA